MTPAPGERLLRFVGDTLSFKLQHTQDFVIPGARALLRTNLGKAATLRREIIATHAGKRPVSVSFWRDVPMQKQPDGNWSIELPLTEPGYFKAKAYIVDPLGRQAWPDGADLGISVHPSQYRSGNTIYCAFTRMFGAGKTSRATRDAALEKKMRELDERGFTVIPASGKFRDLQRELPHIMDVLKCRIVHLLPVNPTPTTYARFGRFGSPYAGQDLIAIDPALVEFDKHTNGVDQFRELAYGIHERAGRVFLDVVINHTGWGSTLFENHPEWFLREADGAFASPGAWGVTWEDLVELNPNFTALWEHFADAFITWCRRGVDGFRCDAGYKVPLPVWQYIEARVRQEFPETVFLLEGLGGSWEATENLLTDGGMQWAYSELFQNYSGAEVQWYLDYALRQGERVGVYVHYSETHDNDRLAKKGRDWSLLRNRLYALTSVAGGFGFTCGVEWLADEKVEVHQSRGLNWGHKENVIPELARLNRLLADHPCFFDGAALTRLSQNAAPVYALQRVSAEGKDTLLVLVNTDPKTEQELSLSEKIFKALGEPHLDLLGQSSLVIEHDEARVVFKLPAGGAYCLAPTLRPEGLSGEAYRRARAQAGWAVHALSRTLLPEQICAFDWRELARLVESNPEQFLAAAAKVADEQKRAGSILESLQKQTSAFPQVVSWTLIDARRITPVPPQHWLLIRDTVPFRASLKISGQQLQEQAESIPVCDGFVACFPPRITERSVDGELSIERYGVSVREAKGTVRFLTTLPSFSRTLAGTEPVADDGLVLLTNGIGGMARLGLSLGRIKSKYDCALGANLHPNLPVDRHIFAKRIRAWINADGFITPLDLHNLASFEVGPPASWRFIAHAGDERTVEVQLTADMLDGRNTTVFRFELIRAVDGGSSRIKDVRITVRVDIEDRSFHAETHRNGGAEHHFGTNTHTLQDQPGFAFMPGPERQLRVYSDRGFYHHQPEWSESIPHPVEQSRAQVGSGDAYSPGWFDLPLKEDAVVSVILCADPANPASQLVAELVSNRRVEQKLTLNRAGFDASDTFGQQLALAVRQFVVRRGTGKTVIAGYPWFLDWGRDTMICARGLLAAGMTSDVTEILINFGRFVENGTMPNTIFGEDASNRDTSDAPLWYGVVCEEAAGAVGKNLYELAVNGHGRTLAEVLREIAVGYLRGTPNGIRMDSASGLIWSPSHFTWMDTNYPAGTPREGYPVEIQVLWIRLLRQLEKLGVASEGGRWGDVADRAEKSLHKLFWLEDRGYLADVLLGKSGTPASEATPDNSLRSNYLLAISLGLLKGEQARRGIENALRYLVVPGALRTLAPLPVSPPLPVEIHGRLINNPIEPYFGRYVGDEDTQRKPAYHNGTAWTWTFPIFCEALAAAWDHSPSAVAAARAYLGSMDRLLKENCLGQLPEIVDGDTPHTQRGCDAQAWGVTEALRVWKLLNR